MTYIKSLRSMDMGELITAAMLATLGVILLTFGFSIVGTSSWWAILIYTPVGLMCGVVAGYIGYEGINNIRQKRAARTD